MLDSNDSISDSTDGKILARFLELFFAYAYSATLDRRSLLDAPTALNVMQRFKNVSVVCECDNSTLERAATLAKDNRARPTIVYPINELPG